MRWAGHVARMEKKTSVYRDLVATAEEQRPLGRPRCRWEDNIKMGLQEVGWRGMDWTDLAEERAMWSAVMKLRVPQNAGNFFS